MKLKTKKAAAKRFKVTGTGKLVFYKTGKKHLLSHKTSKLKRHKNNQAVVGKCDEANIKAMMPTG